MTCDDAVGPDTHAASTLPEVADFQRRVPQALAHAPLAVEAIS